MNIHNTIYKILNMVLFFLLIMTLYFTLTAIPITYLLTNNGIVGIIISLTVIIITCYELYTEKIPLNYFFNGIIIILFINGIVLINSSNTELLFDAINLIVGSNDEYFSFNANNILLRYLFQIVEMFDQKLHLSFFADDLKNFQMIYLIINIINCYLIKKIGTKLFNPKVGYISGMILIYYLLLQPIYMITYSDIVSLLLSLIALNLFLNENKRSFLFVGIIIGINYLIRPSAIIFYLVIIFMVIINFIFPKNKKIKFKKVGISVIMFIITIVIGTNLIYFISDGKYDRNLKVPITHYLSVGSHGDPNVRESNHGVWNEEDYNITYTKRDKKEIIKENINQFLTRIKSRTLVENIKFYLYKLANVIDTGIMYYHRDNLWIRYHEQNNQIGYFYKELFDVDGKYKKIMDVIYHFIWIIIMLFLIPTIFIKNSNLLFLKISLLGSLIFLIIFESGGTKYMIQYSFLIALISGYGINLFLTKIKK